MVRHVASGLAAAAVLCLAVQARAEEKEKEKPKSFVGSVAKVEGASLTVVSRSDKGERSETFAVGADAKVMVETDEDVEVKGGEGGGTKKVPKVVEAKLGDLKVGQRATVLYDEAGKAVKVLGHRAPAKKPSKEGNG